MRLMLNSLHHNLINVVSSWFHQAMTLQTTACHDCAVCHLEIYGQKSSQ